MSFKQELMWLSVVTSFVCQAVLYFMFIYVVIVSAQQRDTSDKEKKPDFFLSEKTLGILAFLVWSNTCKLEEKKTLLIL